MSEFERQMANLFTDLGMDDVNMRRDRVYSGQAHTFTGVRGAKEVRGLTLRDLHDCYVRARCLSSGAFTDKDRALYEEATKGEAAVISENDVYEIEASLDPMAVFQNFACEIERVMGIFPNIQPNAAAPAAHSPVIEGESSRDHTPNSYPSGRDQ